MRPTAAGSEAARARATIRRRMITYGTIAATDWFPGEACLRCGELRVEAGNGRLRFDDPARLDYSGVLGSIAYNRRVAAHSQVTLDAARDLSFSVFAANDYFLMDRAGLSTEWSATRRLSLRAGAQVGRNSYQVPVNGILRRDRYTYPWVGFLWSIRRVRAGFDVGYYDRTSNFPDIDEENGIRIVLRLSFSP